MAATMRSAVWSSSDSPYTCLKDTERTLALRRAIRQAVRPGDVVVEAGAGTGILSFFAAEAGAARVYAVEIDPLLAEAVRRAAARNGLADRVTVVEGDARDVALPLAADVVIGELIETGLIEELQVPVFNALHARGVIGPRTRLIPEAYATTVELVDVDQTFYGLTILAPFHEWPPYLRPADGWWPTNVRVLTHRAGLGHVDFRRPVAPLVDRTLELVGLRDGVANAARLAGVAQLARGLVLGQTNALNGDKILHLPTPLPVAAGERQSLRLRYVMGGGLASVEWAAADAPA